MIHKARWMRRILGVVLGAIAAVATIFLFEWIAQALYPIPESWESASRADVAAVMDAIPLPAKLIVVGGWFAGAFCGAWLALRVSDWGPAAWIVGALLIAGGSANLVAIPHPVWMQAATVIAPLAGVWLARRVHRKPYRGEPLLG